jgi:HEAT repeat protein
MQSEVDAVVHRSLQLLLRDLTDRLDGAARASAVKKAVALRESGVVSIDDLFAVDAVDVPNPSVRAFAYWAIARIDHPDAPVSLLRGSEDSAPAVRREAIAGLEHVDVLAAAHRLVEALADTDLSVRITAVLALRGHPHRATEPLLSLIQDRDASSALRGAAAEALASHKDSRTRSVLIDATTDNEPEVRYWAAFALGQRGEPEALPALDALAVDATSIPRLGVVGDAAREAACNIRERIEF